MQASNAPCVCMCELVNGRPRCDASARFLAQETGMQGGVVIVTGAFGALGHAVVTAAREAGFRIAAIDHTSHAEENALVGPDGHAEGGVDLADSAAASAAIARVKAKLGRIDALVNIA